MEKLPVLDGKGTFKQIDVFHVIRSGSHHLVTCILGQSYFGNDHVSYIFDNCKHKGKFYKVARCANDIRTLGIKRKPIKQVLEHKQTLLIVRHENWEMKEIKENLFPKWIGETDKHFAIFILRDFFNWLASCFGCVEHLKRAGRKKFFGMKLDKEKMMENFLIPLWIQYAEAFLDPVLKQKKGVIFIKYNDLVSKKNYLKFLCSRIGIEFICAKAREEVSIRGDGSSFNGVKFNGEGSKMKVMERWKRYRTDPLYKYFIENKHAVNLSLDIFGHISGTEVLDPCVSALAENKGISLK